MTSVGGEPVPGVEGEPLPSIEAQPLLEGEPLPDVGAQPLLAPEGQAVAGDAMGTPELLDVTAPAPMPEGPLLEEGATIEESAPLQPLATAEPELELEMEALSPVEAEPVGLSAEPLDDDLHDIGVSKKGGAFKYVAILILLAVLGGAAAWALGLLEIPGLEPPAATARLLGRQEPPDQLVTNLQPVADDTTAGVVVDAGSESAAAADVAGSGTEADTGAAGDTELADHGADASAEDAGEPEPEPAVEPEPEPEPAVEPEPEPTKKQRQRKRKRRGSRIRKPPKRPSPAKKPAAGGGADEHYAAAVGYVKQKKPTKAIDELKKAIKANSRHAKSYRLLGMAFKMIGQEKKAIQAWERFVKLDPGHADSAKLRAIIADYYKRNPR
jgi:outer membrane biosynthesis protein TonB